jgi:hypothetical protein
MLVTTHHIDYTKVKLNLLSTLTPIAPDIPLPPRVQTFLLPQAPDLFGLQPFIVAIIPLRNIVSYGDILNGAREEQLKSPPSSLPRADKDVREAGWVEELASAYKRRRC